MAKSRVGKDLFEKVFATYTKKQWDKEPKELDALVTARIPVRNNFDPRYFSDKYQVLPSKGYTKWFVPVLLTAYLLTIVATCNMPLTAAMRGAICRWCRASVVTVPTTRHRKVSSKAHSNINQQEAMLSAKAAQFLPKMHCGVVRTRHFSVYACLWQEDCFAMSCSLKHQFVRASLFSLMQGNSAVSTCSISGLPALPWCTRGGGVYRIVWR